MTTMKTHWVADLYPLNDEDVEALAADIKANGQRLPIQMLKDGRIIDGRNRWLACQKAGVEPMVEILNPNGEEIDDEELFAISTSNNSMRRDQTTSLRACLAAEAWKKLFPEGNAPGQGRKKKGEEINSKNGDNFAKFAKDNFKVSSGYANQALAILNKSPLLFKEAKTNLAGAYETHLKKEAEAKERLAELALLDADPEVKERVANKELSEYEALAIVKAKNAEKLKEEEAENFRRTQILRSIYLMADTVQMNVLKDTEILEWMESQPMDCLSEKANTLSQNLESAAKLLLKIAKSKS